MEIRANPELADINHLKLEIKDYVQHQFVEKIFTRNTVANRTAVLIRDSAFCSSFALPSGAGDRWW